MTTKWWRVRQQRSSFSPANSHLHPSPFAQFTSLSSSPIVYFFFFYSDQHIHHQYIDTGGAGKESGGASASRSHQPVGGVALAWASCSGDDRIAQAINECLLSSLHASSSELQPSINPKFPPPPGGTMTMSRGIKGVSSRAPPPALSPTKS